MLKSLSKLTLIFIGCGFLAFLLYAAYFTYVYPPIETYEFANTTPNQLHQALIDYIGKHPNQNYKDSDTVGSQSTGFAYYMDVTIESDTNQYEFTIRYEEVKSIWKKSSYSEVGLISAFNNKVIGGYEREDPGVEAMVKIFNDSIIKPLVKVRDL